MRNHFFDTRSVSGYQIFHFYILSLRSLLLRKGLFTALLSIFAPFLQAQVVSPTPPVDKESQLFPKATPFPPAASVPSYTPAAIETAAPFQTPQPFSTPLPPKIAPSGTLMHSGASSPIPSDTFSPSSEKNALSGTSSLIHAPSSSSLAPLIAPTPFPTVPLNTPPPGAFSTPGPGGAQPTFPSALLPSVSLAQPAPLLPHPRVAKTTELDVDAPQLTLDDAIQYALAHNPDILYAVEQIRLTRGQLISIRAKLLPQFIATGTFFGQSPDLADPPRPPLDLSAPSIASDGTIQDTKIGTTDTTINNYIWNVQLGAQQLLFDGGGAFAATRAAKYQEDRSYFMLRSVIDRIIAKIKIAFFQVVLNRSLIIVNEQSVALLENQLEDQESRYQAGTVPKFNVLQAQVAVANAIPPLITARNNLRISQYELVRLLGMNYIGDPTQVPFNVTGTLAVNFRTIIPDEAIRIGLTRNPFLKAQRENILSQAASVTAALSGFYPKIVGSAGYMSQNNYNYQSLGNAVEGWFFGFTGTWNIFDGLNTYGRVVQVKAQLEQSKISYDNSVRTVILEIQQNISHLQEAQETIDSQKANVIQATEALRLSRERLTVGAGTQLDVLNGQVALLQAQTTVLQAQFNYIKFLAEYDAALSLNTQYAEIFRDPLENKEKWRFAKLNGAGYKMPRLPRVYRHKDPVVPILGPTRSPTPFRLSRPHSTPKPSRISHSHP